MFALALHLAYLKQRYFLFGLFQLSMKLTSVGTFLPLYLLFRDCEIKSITNYGAFVEIAPGREVQLVSLNY